jgi:hypothetical protein
MPAAGRGATVLAMTSTSGRRTIRVDLDLVPDVEPIRGVVRAADGVVRPFSGWLELIQFLEKARISGSPGASEWSSGQDGED